MNTSKVLIIGIDGFDPVLLRQAMDEGRAPHCARLRAGGAFLPLATANPAQSPVAWACLATGRNPGHHGLFDFIARDPKTYLPRLALLDVNTHNLLGKRSEMFRPVMHGTPFWELTSKNGVPTSVIKWPVNFPPTALRGNALAGLGVPDVRTTLGRYTLFTESPEAFDDPKGDIVRLIKKGRTYRPAGDHPKGSEASFIGPNRSKIPLTIDIHSSDEIVVTIHSTVTSLKVGQWSPWVKLAFSHALGRRIAAQVRLFFASIEPLRLYATSPHVDPAKPAFSISYPDSYAQELYHAIGPYHTLGLPEETNGVIDEALPFDGFAQLLRDIQQEREKMFAEALSQFREGVLAFVFDTIDRAQHIFWMARDVGHPLHDAATNQYEVVIREFYERMDAVVGRVLDGLGEDTTLIIVSDHGFSTFRRAVHVNSWLREQGYLVLKSANEGKPLFHNVDWARTKAYALGFSSIFLNMAGREAHGCVKAADMPALMQELSGKLLALEDPKTRTSAVRAVYKGSNIYHGPLAAQGPDLVIGFQAGFRASWQTAVGAAPVPIFEDNRKRWTGDHLIDPPLVPGVLLCSKPVQANSPSVFDLAPSILALLSIEPQREFDGKSWW